MPSRDQLLLDIEELRGRLERMGEVNLAAIGEYEELTSRFQFMSQQKEDLEKSIADLQQTIVKLNRICRLRFKESFESINEKFEAIFPRLFRGGKARLVLTDENDFLETGVDIIVQPPGKKLQSITLLSGGEKALTAVSLLFAIFLTKPSPFCFLDEVDAPLDDANLDRFNDMIQRDEQPFAIRPGDAQQEDHGIGRDVVRHHHGRTRGFQSRLGAHELSFPPHGSGLLSRPVV